MTYVSLPYPTDKNGGIRVVIVPCLLILASFLRIRFELIHTEVLLWKFNKTSFFDT